MIIAGKEGDCEEMNCEEEVSEVETNALKVSENVELKTYLHVFAMNNLRLGMTDYHGRNIGITHTMSQPTPLLIMLYTELRCLH